MAGIKVTDLPVLGAAAADDVFYIVDTSTNTSSQIEVGDILSSGDFSPTISAEADCNASVLRALYSRVGNVVTVSYYFSITLDPTFATGVFNVSLPVASNFSNVRDAFGVITPITDFYSELVSAVTNADIATNDINITIELLTAGGNITFVNNIQYLVIP
jgi:hypothetical protein